MLSRARGFGLGVAMVLLVACEIFAVRMPSHAAAGSSIDILVDLRFQSGDTTPTGGTHCARLPSAWAVTQATYSRTIDGVTTAGTSTVNTSVAASLNGGAEALAGHTWVCYEAPSADYTAGDFGTGKLRVTVQTPGTYDLLFTLMSSTTIGTRTNRRFTVDAMPDWRFDSRAVNLLSATESWSSVKAVTDLGLLATDLAGNVHISTDGGANWSTNDIAAGRAFLAIERLGNLTIAVGDNGAIYTATNVAGTWTSRAAGSTTTNLRKICTDGTTLYAVGGPAWVATSVNGTTWFGAAPPFQVDGCAAIPGGGAVGVGGGGRTLRITHTGAAPTFFEETAVPGGAALRDVVYVATPTPRLVAFADDAVWVREVTAASWTRTGGAPEGSVARARVFGGTVYAVGSNGRFSGSPASDLSVWTSFGSGTSARLTDIAVTGKVASLVGERGVILRIGLPNLAFDGSTLTLERTEPGVPRNATISLRNDGKGVLYTSAPVIAPPFTASSDCDGALAEGEECEVTVTLTTATRGLHTASLTVPSSSPAQTTIAVTGSVGSAASVALTVDGTTALTALDFGSVAVGTTAARTALLRNAGDLPLTVGAVASLVVPRSPYAITDNQCGGQTVAAGATCPIVVSFRPTGEGGAAQAFDVASNDTAHPQFFVHLVGTGAPAADIRVSRALAFPDTPVGDSAEVALRVSNVGRGPLEVRGLATTGDAFTVVSDAAFTVAAGETVERAVRFAPTAEGTQTGQIVITSNDPDQADEAVTMTAIALAESSGSSKDDGCAAVDGSLATLAICAFAACRCAARRRRRKAPNHA